MGSIISLIMSTDSPVLIVILAIVLVYLFVKAVYDAGKWILDRLNGYHKLRNEEETIEERIARLEKHDKGQYTKLNELGEELKKIINMVQKVQDTQAKAIIDTHRDAIFTIYHDSIAQGSIRKTELDRFLDIVKRYKEAGGDGIVDEKIYPEILELPIVND